MFSKTLLDHFVNTCVHFNSFGLDLDKKICQIDKLFVALPNIYWWYWAYVIVELKIIEGLENAHATYLHVDQRTSDSNMCCCDILALELLIITS
jgi:hypothetical protein